MTNLDRATKIRRTVYNKAYQLLENCKEPEPIFDGYDMRDKEHWHLEQQRLEEEVIDELADEWPEVVDDEIVNQIQTHCKLYLESDQYQKDKQEVRNDYYQDQQDRKAIAQTNRAHQPSVSYLKGIS